MGKELDLSQSQQKTLTEFKARISDVIKSEHDDYYLLKWLKARSFNLTKAEQMYRDSLAFKEKMQVSSLLDGSYTIPKVLAEYFPGGMCGYDKDGSPLCVELFGCYDLKGLMLSTRRSELEKLKLYSCEMAVEECKRQSAKLGRRVDGITVIFDMENVGTKFLWRPGLEMYLHLIKVLEDNYPEMAKRLIVVHAPSIFPILYRLCRPLVSEEMKKKIVVLGSNFKTEILKFADEDQLPVYLGGRLTDPDGNPRCPSLIRQGGTVPRSYYLSETLDDETMKTAVIANGESLKIDFHVTRSDSVLRWEFRTEGYDIGFGVTFVSENDERKQIIPVKKINSHLVTEDDSINCTYVGTYTVVFDNTSSWTKSKKVFYRVELHSVDELTEKEVEELCDTTDF